MSIIFYISSPASVCVFQGNSLPANPHTLQANRTAHLKSVHFEMAPRRLIVVFYFLALSFAPNLHVVLGLKLRNQLLQEWRKYKQIPNLVSDGIR